MIDDTLLQGPRYGPRSFTVAGPSIWNSIPNCHVPSSFHREMKTELFNRAYHYHARDCLRTVRASDQPHRRSGLATLSSVGAIP